MSTTTRAVGLLVFAGAVLLVVQTAGQSGADRDRDATGRGRSAVPVRLIATVQQPRDYQLTWTAAGRKPPAVKARLSPWEKTINATPGSVVTFTVRPLIGGPGEHTCTIEQPPGVPLPGHAHQVGGGTTPIMCTATIGA